LTEIVLQLDDGELGSRHNVVINGRIGEAATFDRGLQESAKALHGKCPVCPDRPRPVNSISDVEKAVDCQGAEGKTIRCILIVEPESDYQF
jgi:hypothetical protein